ncbi:unnamed protein product [Prorocentrum cordatum]|uniref:Uncharacterized protein n=1 Tax=Prorocentrum cordatum TaxID=2364126 RepID=A0ABN9UGM0_9DINO|nr:unnamed protein product [Polarella glacialis]
MAGLRLPGMGPRVQTNGFAARLDKAELRANAIIGKITTSELGRASKAAAPTFCPGAPETCRPAPRDTSPQLLPPRPPRGLYSLTGYSVSGAPTSRANQKGGRTSEGSRKKRERGEEEQKGVRLTW